MQRTRTSGQVVVPTLTMMEAIVSRLGGIAPVSYDVARATVGQWYRAGVTILAGTDANQAPSAPASPPYGTSLHHELELLVGAGLSAVDAIRSATVLAAQQFGLSDRGVIAAGKRADLVLVDGDPCGTSARSETSQQCGAPASPSPTRPARCRRQERSDEHCAGHPHRGAGLGARPMNSGRFVISTIIRSPNPLPRRAIESARPQTRSCNWRHVVVAPMNRNATRARRRGAVPIEMAVPVIPPHRIRRISAVYHDQPDELRTRISVIQQTSRPVGVKQGCHRLPL